MFGGLFKAATSISSIAKQVTGSVGGFRAIMALNPALAPFTFPSTIQMGLNVARQVGLKLPSDDAIKGFIQGKVGGFFSSIQRPLQQADKVLTRVELIGGKIVNVSDTINEKLATAEQLASQVKTLDSLSWLIG